jgi:hypothetical protein
MKKAIISFLLIAPVTAWCAGASDLQPTAPDRYTVAPGDTLWSISARYLKSPWRWPELWNLNNQVENPHRIYPGDVLVLQRASGASATVVASASAPVTIRLEPRIRVEQREAKPIPPIPLSEIGPFLSRPLVVNDGDLERAPRIVATEEDRVALGAGNVAYVEGVSEEQGKLWQIYRRGDPIADPETGDFLGYVAVYLGEARVRKFGPVSTVEITRSTQEIYQGDRLVPAAEEKPNFGFQPHAPDKPLSARIVSNYGALHESGPLSIVVLSKGARDGLEAGNVLALYRDPTTSRRVRTDPLYGRSGPSGSDAPVTYYSEQLTPRDGPLYSRAIPVTGTDLAKLPAERYGLVMVFRAFDRASFGIVLEASRPVAVSDILVNP